MVEVFSTNIQTEKQADRLLMRLQKAYPTYRINFDLEDCDNILRVESQNGKIDNKLIVNLIEENGFFIEVLPDTIPIEHSVNIKDRNNG